MKNKIFEIVITALLVIVLALQVVILVGVYGISAEKEASGDAESTQSDIDLSVVSFDTPYCTVQFPSEWMEQLKIEEKTEGDVYSAVFICEIGEKRGELFTVTFGAEDEEYSVGTITNNGKEIPVALKPAKLDRSAWTSEEYKIVSKMQKAKEKVVDSILAHEDIF